MCHNIKPKKILEANGYGCLRDNCIRITEHKGFDLTIMIVILMNTFLMAFDWYMQPVSFNEPIEIINYIFMLVFTIEAILKILSMRRDYFKEAWNCFDFTVVAATIVILILNWSGVGESVSILSIILRTLRIGRVFRLVNNFQKLKEIFMTLIDAAPAMGSLGLLLFLLLFMFSVIGIAQFGLVSLNGASEMSNHVNF